MKKLPIIIIVVLAVAIASFLWVRGQIGVTDPARLVPPGTVALVSVPDLPRSAMRWPRTTLAKIGAEPEVQAFLERPLSTITGTPAADEAQSLLWGLKPGRLFAAVLGISDGRPAILIGFQFWGSKQDFEAAVSRLRQEIHRGAIPTEAVEEFAGTRIVATPLEEGSLFTAAKGRWGFVSNDREAITSALERLGGGGHETLASDTTFQSAVARLAADPDLLIFARPGSFVDALLEVGTRMGATPDERQIAQVRKTEAVGFAARIQGTEIHDTLFLLRRDPPEVGTLTHSGMAYTAGDTVGYFNFLLRFEELAALAENLPVDQASPWQGGDVSAMLSRLPEALGNEVSLSLSWRPQSIRPEAIGTIVLRDPVLAETLLMEAASGLPETTISEGDGYKFYGFPSLRSPFMDPALAMGNGVLLVGIDRSELERTIAARGDAPTLESSLAFAPALPAYNGANETFGFIDTKGVFERMYPLMRQMFIFGAALMPDASQVVDASKLPETDTIAKHLTPMIYSQSRFPDGTLAQSSGPISMNQAALAAAGIGAAIFTRRSAEDQPTQE